MKNKLAQPNTQPDDQTSLRAKAEAQVDVVSTNKAIRSPAELLHELQVYQIELEMQNEALKQSLVTLEQSSERWSNFYDFSPIGYLTLSRDALITEINLTGAKLLGEERGKLGHRDFASFVAPKDMERWRRFFGEILLHDFNQGCEVELLRRDGSLLHIQIECLRLIDDASTTEVRVVLTDISVRKELGNSLRESQERRLMLEQVEIIQTSLDGFWTVNAQTGQILEVNDRFCSMVGYSREEILVMGINDLDAMETPEITRARIKAIQEVGYARFETRHRHKQGYTVDFEVSVTHSKSDGGKNFAFFRDITERKKAEIFKKSIQNSIPAEIVVLDRNGIVVDVNEPWNRLAIDNCVDDKPMPSTAIGANYVSGFQTSAADGIQDVIDGIRAVQDGRLKLFSREYSCHSPRQQRWFSMNVVPLGDDVNNGVVVTRTDITDRKLLEREYGERRAEMDSLQKMHVAAQTALAVAHEINQPLFAIASYSKAARMMLKGDNPDYAEISNAVERCEEQSLRAGQSIRDLINFLNRGDSPRVPFNLNKEVVEIAGIAQTENSLGFHSIFKLAAGHPLVLANRTHVQKVLLNLIHNGIDSMQEAGVPLPTITLTTRTTKDDRFAQVTIKDNGLGIRKDEQHRLFEPFFTTKTNGMGMGLTISRSLIEENGGQLWVDPKESHGATFHLTLPLAP